MSQPPAWVADYIGVPFLGRGRDRAGCDCWGLVRLVLAEQFGIAVPSYAGDYATVGDHGRLAELVETGKAGDWQEVDQARAGDVVLLRLRGLPIHVGVVVAEVWMLHTHKTADAVLDRFGGLEWRNRVLGLYRHRGITTMQSIMASQSIP